MRMRINVQLKKMSKIKIYHNPRCSKSRMAKVYLEDKGLNVEVVEYLKDTLSVAELTKTIKLLDIKPIELVRKGEAVYKEQFKGKDLSDIEWIEAMVNYPKLMERPIVINGNKAVVARPAELINEIL